MNSQPQSTTHIMIRTLSYRSQVLAQNKLKNYQSYAHKYHPYFIKIIDAYIRTISSEQWQLIVTFQCPSITLRKQLLLRKNTMQNYTEEQIWQIIQTIRYFIKQYPQHSWFYTNIIDHIFINAQKHYQIVHPQLLYPDKLINEQKQQFLWVHIGKFIIQLCMLQKLSGFTAQSASIILLKNYSVQLSNLVHRMLNCHSMQQNHLKISNHLTTNDFKQNSNMLNNLQKLSFHRLIGLRKSSQLLQSSSHYNNNNTSNNSNITLTAQKLSLGNLMLVTNSIENSSISNTNKVKRKQQLEPTKRISFSNQNIYHSQHHKTIIKKNQHSFPKCITILRKKNNNHTDNNDQNSSNNMKISHNNFNDNNVYNSKISNSYNNNIFHRKNHSIQNQQLKEYKIIQTPCSKLTQKNVFDMANIDVVESFAQDEQSMILKRNLAIGQQQQQQQYSQSQGLHVDSFLQENQLMQANYNNYQESLDSINEERNQTIPEVEEQQSVEEQKQIKYQEKQSREIQSIQLNRSSASITFDCLDTTSQNSNNQYKMINYQQGASYEGYITNNMRHGVGKLMYIDGGYYEGQWKNDKMHGFGKLFYASGRMAYGGSWQNDQFHGNGLFINQLPQSIHHQGFNYHDLTYIGMKWISYDGQFNHDQKHGKGILKLSNGEYFKGTWFHNIIQGQGQFHTKSNKNIIYGTWNDNVLVQQVIHNNYQQQKQLQIDSDIISANDFSPLSSQDIANIY